MLNHLNTKKEKNNSHGGLTLNRGLKRSLTIYTDGSCLRNPGGAGGYGAAILEHGEKIKELWGHHPSTTNNRMEIMGVVAALEWLSEPCVLTIYSDSQYVINTMAKGWKKRMNLDLWERMDAACAGHEIRWKWVRGHNGNRWNEYADMLADYSAREGKRA